MKSLTLAALDIGTTGIKLLVAKKDLATGKITLLSQNKIPCFGVRKGEVFKPQEVSHAIANAKKCIEKLSIGKIKSVIVNISGSRVYSLASQGLVSVSRADQKISKEDVQRVISASEAVNLPSNKQILMTVPKEFIVDGEEGVENPEGLNGVRLEVKVLLACVFSPFWQNLKTAVIDAGLNIDEIVPSPLASAKAVLTPEQKELGVAVVDIGAGTTSVSVFSEGKLCDFVIFPIGSANITNDIAILLRTEISTAERIKKEFATLSPLNGKKKDVKIEIPEKALCFTGKFLRGIVEARISEIMFEVSKSLKKISKQNFLPGGVVLTGGGSILPGLKDFTKKKLSLPCYLSGPKNIPGVEDPVFSVCAGLLLLGFESEDGLGMDKENIPIWDWLKKIFSKLFNTFSP